MAAALAPRICTPCSPQGKQPPAGARAQCTGGACSPHAGAACSWGERCPVLPVTRAVKAASAAHVPWGSHQQACAELISYSCLVQDEKCCSTGECLWKVYYCSGDSLPGRRRKQQVLVTSLDEIQREQAPLPPGPSTEDPGTHLHRPGCVHAGSRGASTATSQSLCSQHNPREGAGLQRPHDRDAHGHHDGSARSPPPQPPAFVLKIRAPNRLLGGANEL